MEFINSIPLGYRFSPKDDELIEHYLMKKINGEQLPTINDFQEIYINNYHPQELCTAENRHKRGNNWYFFTRRERKYQKGCIPNRKVEGSKGFWKATGNDVEIKKNGQIIGYKKILDFQEEKGIKSKWKMHEFRINKKSSPPDANCSSENQKELDKYVLCEIYISTRTNNNSEVLNYRNDGNIIQPTSDNIEEVKHVSHNVNIIQATSDNINEDRNVSDNDNIIDQDDDSILENVNMYPWHEQNFVGINNNLEFGGNHQFVQEITTPNLLSSSSSNHVDHLPNYCDHDGNNVYHYKGFDELGVVVRPYLQMKKFKEY
ncbi:NAC domain-containing protein 2-like [Solanum dulcamara]|uniref:NAC domain-containing protein 2-like n=1 Tax=Solanum dulcamara TaxID=45834 RepID=UPI00248617D0|nr:NAC domain-containing protein 2-like [Solanum dulcamara]